jgi:hypothetical protein
MKEETLEQRIKGIGSTSAVAKFCIPFIFSQQKCKKVVILALWQVLLVFYFAEFIFK